MNSVLRNGHVQVLGVKWSPTGEQLVTVGVKHIRFWTPAGAGFTGKNGLYGDASMITTHLCVAFARDGTCFTGGANGMVHRWDGTKLASRVQAHSGAVMAICGMLHLLREKQPNYNKKLK